MRDNKNIFKEEHKKSNSLKYFIISFSVFIVILAACSAFLLMKSLDFDLGNIVETSTGEQTDTETETKAEAFSVNGLTGKSNLLFICTDENGEYNFSFTVATDFDSKSMAVKTYGKTAELSEIYRTSSVTGLKSALNIAPSKYVKFTDNELKKILSLFDNITVNIGERVDFRSSEFNLQLDEGRQQLSDDYLSKLLLISEDYMRSTLICDIINSVLTPENADNSNALFKDFVNLCETDISVIDYSNSAETLEAYSKSADKFLPSAVK